MKPILIILAILSFLLIERLSPLNTTNNELSSEHSEPITFSPKGKYVLLKDTNKDHFKLIIYDPKKKQRLNIHKSERNQISLHFSPDNKKLIFQSRNSSNLFELILLNIEDNSATKLNAPHSLSGLPSIYWSSNSKEVAYYEVRKDGTILYIDNVYDQDWPRVLTNVVTIDSVLAWSPNGEELLVYSGVEGSDLLRINRNGEIISRYPQSEGCKIKEILWATSGVAYLVRHPKEAEFNQLAHLNLVDGSIKTIITEEANIENLLALPKINSILYHSSHRGISNAKIFNDSSNNRITINKLDKGSLKIHSLDDQEGLLLGVQYSYSEKPRLIKIDIATNLTQYIYDEILTHEKTIPPSKIIEIDNAGDPFRSFLWEPNESDHGKNGIIFVHGGPAAFIGPEWNRDFATFVDSGWAVLAPNYHGSSNEGARFLKNNALTMQIEDIISSIKYMRGYIPKNGKLFIAGQSYGSRLVIESLKEIGELVDGVILTSSIQSSVHEIPCIKRPSYIRAFHGREDNLNSAENISTYLQQILGKDNFEITILPEEGHIFRRESSFRNIRSAILENKIQTRHRCP